MSESDAITFGEKVLALLDQGAFTTTYKYAVLLALLDACLEGVDASGSAPRTIHPRRLGRRVVELYWPHTAPFGAPHGAGEVLLRQTTTGVQAEIVSLVGRFRQASSAGADAPLARARAADPGGFTRLLADVTWKLVEMPLPRLQRFGGADDRFLYDLAWDERISRGRFERGEVDPLLHLRDGVGDHLVRLAGLLRPLVQRQWANRVVELNRRHVPALDEQGYLDVFLFGASRIDLAPVRHDLRELQGDCCFYCRDRLARAVEVDHFLPWARHPDDGIHNLVVAHPRCNNRKRDFLAAGEHVVAWSERFQRPELGGALATIADAHRWAAHPGRTLSVARAVYLRLPSDARLWRLGQDFVAPDHRILERALTGERPTAPSTRDRMAAEDHADFDAQDPG